MSSDDIFLLMDRELISDQLLLSFLETKHLDAMFSASFQAKRCWTPAEVSSSLNAHPPPLYRSSVPHHHTVTSVSAPADVWACEPAGRVQIYQKVEPVCCHSLLDKCLL